MKKTYIKPTVHSIAMVAEAHLCQASGGTIDPETKRKKFYFDVEYDEEEGQW